jgi:hypothetical protein
MRASLGVLDFEVRKKMKALKPTIKKVEYRGSPQAVCDRKTAPGNTKTVSPWLIVSPEGQRLNAPLRQR